MYRWVLLAAIACLGSVLWWRGSVVPSHVVRVGVTAGPHAMIAENVKSLMASKGVDVQIVEFNDFHIPNAALEAGELDLNIYQHEPFLQEDSRERGLNLKIVGKSVLMPMGLYSKKYQKIEDLPKNAHIALPNDPTNRDRAKAICQQILLDGAQFTEVDAAQLPRSLDDVDAALIPTDWIVLAKIDPNTALYRESAQNSPYTNVIVAHANKALGPNVQSFLDHYQSSENKKFVEKAFEGMLVAGWPSAS